MSLNQRCVLKLCLCIFLLTGFGIAADAQQLTGSKFIPGDYATVAAAVSDLNSKGVGAGGVVFNIAAGHSEQLAGVISLTATGTATDSIVFRKDPATTGANPLITAYAGGTGTPATAVQDGIWRLVGSDYVVIDGIELAENPANTTDTASMEYGFALYRGSTTNGCQNNIIRNCVISLNINNRTAGGTPMVDGSCGILSANSTATAATTALSPTTGGQNSGNKFYSNTVRNCNTGIALIGYAASAPYTRADFNNDIGGSSAATGNTIINYGGGTGATATAVAIRTLAQYELNVSWNTVNNNDGNGVNHPAQLKGIQIGAATSANVTISNNTVTLKGGGTTQHIYGIENAAGSTAAGNTVSITANTITGCTYTTATTGGFYGILNSASPATMNITGNDVSGNSTAATTTGFLYGYYNSGVATNVNISNNTFSGNSTAALTSGLFVGFYNAASAPNVSVSTNTVYGNTTTATTGVFYAIYSTGTVTTTINFSGNSIGTVSQPAVTFANANSGTQIMISNTKGSTASALTISGNTFHGVGYTVAGTGSLTFISNGAASSSQVISSNTFTNLSINTSGNTTLISNSVSVAATGTQQISNNSISGTLTKTAAGGTLTICSISATSAAGAVITHSGNNFSNITVSGATAITGWANTDAGAGTKLIENNTFSNWTGGTGTITAMSISNTSAACSTRNNQIFNLTGGGIVTGIATGAGNDHFYSNTIRGLSNTANAAVNGISISGGTTKHVHRNKIYDLQTGGATGSVLGISVSGTTGAVVTGYIYNNIIGDLRAPVASATDPVRGISLTSTRANSTLNVYNNTIYLSATSSGTNFGTTGIYHTGSTTATTAALNLRNNIVANYSTANGTGLIVAFRKGSTSLANYISTSDNNIFYAGTPGAKNLIFYNGTNSDQTIGAYKTRVASRDAGSVTEDIAGIFLSLTGSSSDFLHLNPTIATQAESGAGTVSGLTADFDGNVRHGDTLYTGTGTAPDIGADEFEGIRALPLNGTYTVGSGGNYTSLTKTGGLFAAINSLGLSGDVEVNIISDLSEDGSNMLSQWENQGSGSHSVTIQPSAAAARLISGSNSAALIRLTGADRVIFDGSYNGTGKYLTFRNTNTSGTGIAFSLTNAATNNTITNCNIEAYGNATNGAILFGTSTEATGNNNNTISNCSINATISGNVSNVAIYSGGTTGRENTANIISGNTVYNYRDRGLDISATGSTGWTISGNSFHNGAAASGVDFAAATTLQGFRILGGSGHTITGNYVGGTAALAGGSQAVYTSTTGLLTYVGIQVTTSSATPATNIKGNVVANIAVNAVPTSTSTSGTNVFHGIETNGTGINIGGTGNGDGNLVGSATANGSIAVTTTSASASNRTNVRGIICNSTGGAIIGNQVAGFDITNLGSVVGPTTFTAIYASAATAPSQINSNTVGAAPVSNSIRVTAGSLSASPNLHGITLTSGVTSTVQIDGNTIRDLSVLSTSAVSGNITGINLAAAGAAVVNVTNNTFRNNYYNVFSSGTFYGIRNTGASTALNITGNILAAQSTNSTSGVYNAIINSGAVTGSVTISGNSIGTSGLDAITFNAANSGSQSFINNSGGTATCALTISSNTFQKINYAAASTGTNTYIVNSAATLTQAINGNIFTDLNVNTSGNLTFISNNVAVGATGTQNVNNNAISGSFTKRAGGTITLFTSAAATAAGGVVNQGNNNFSNITVTGATTIAGWVKTDAGAGEKNIENNTFSNWTGGTATITAMSLNLSGSASYVSGNTISNFSTGAAINGISTAAGEESIHGNTINTLYTTGSAAVVGINITAGTSKKIYRNKIYDLQSGGATGTVNGMLISGTTATGVTIHNNLIGDMKAPAASSTSDAVRGISITATAANATYNIYYNTIYLNASSTGTNFSTSCIFHTGSATATTAVLNLRNNSLTNLSTPKGTGTTAVLRRGTSSSLSNYAGTSNNNLFYAGTPGSTRFIYYYDATNSDQTLAAFKTRVNPREAQSVTEDLSTMFLSTNGASAVFLHMNEAMPSVVESGAQNIAGFAEDFDAQIRQGNTGYNGTGYAPDIGADEIFGIEVIPPAISYTALTDTTSTVNRVLQGVTITDGSGINTTAGSKPRIYYKRLTDANTFVDNTANTNGWKFTEATNSSSPFSFTINYSLLYGGGAVTAGVIQYFIVAQDLSTPANVAINSGSFTSAPASVGLTAAAFPITGTVNSYKIPFSGTVDIGSGKVYTSLTGSNGVFGAINAVGLMGTTTITITSDLNEDGTNALNQWLESGTGSYQLIIRPENDAVKTISGNAPAGLIRLNGADRVRIDGSFGGSGPFLLFRNTNSAGIAAPAISFADGTTNDTIRYCTAEAYTGAGSGVICLGAGSGSGNTGITVEYNTINATVNGSTGSAGIYSEGTPGAANSNVRIAGNNVTNFRDAGIEITVTGSDAWTITGNSLYTGSVSSSISYPNGSSVFGIRIAGGSGYTVSGNFFGGNAEFAGGSNAVYSSPAGDLSVCGIYLNASGGAVSSIKSNTVARITVSSVPQSDGVKIFTGIEAQGSDINIGAAGEGNLIGSNSTNGSITINTTTTVATNTTLVTGILAGNTGSVITGNQVAGVDIINGGGTPSSSDFKGIYITAVTPPAAISSNIIGSHGTGASSNSIRVRNISFGQTPSVKGIVLDAAATGSVVLNSNIINNVTVNSPVSSGIFTGIEHNAPAATASVTGNTVSTVTAAANISTNSGLFAAIVTKGPATISGNTVDLINSSASGNQSRIAGILTEGSHNFTISGNTITRLYAASTKTADIETAAPADLTVAAIAQASPAATTVINGNIISDCRSTTTAAVHTAVAAMALAGDSASVFNNKTILVTNSATGTAITPGIGGIVVYSGHALLYNNALYIANGANTNGVRIYGLQQSTTGSLRAFYNTFVIAGNTSGTAARTAAFMRNAAGTSYLRNNIFLNTRSGTGTHHGISNMTATPATGWSATASDHNNIYSSNTANTAEWGMGNRLNFAQWKVSSGGDAASVSRFVSFLLSTYDLEPDGAANCGLDGAGISISSPVSITQDIRGNARPQSATDIGAYEFSYAPFTITVSSNSPVCAGGDVELSVDPGDALTPGYNWTNPQQSAVATSQNPAVPALAGYYKVIVTDITGCTRTDSTAVTLITRPTASISGSTSACEAAPVTLTIAVTGTGTIEGELNTGDLFSGTAPTITLNVNPGVTTPYFVTSLNDNNCSSLPADLEDTALVAVIFEAVWTGNAGTSWNDNGNWYCGSAPDEVTDVIIPSGTATAPLISSGIALARDISIAAGATLTVTGTLQIEGDISGSGKITASGGTIIMKGSAQQTIPAGIFTGNTVQHLTIQNSAGVVLGGPTSVSGVLKLTSGNLNSSGNLTLLSAPTGTALVDGSGNGNVTGNATMQRFLSSGFGYRYIASPFTAATAAQLAEELDLDAAFPRLYRYDENQEATGWVDYSTAANLLEPMKGYAANFGNVNTPKTISITGVLNNGTIAASVLSNHNRTYTQGFHLVGNPYPSPIDWNAQSGWTRTNIDNAVYYFNTGTTDQFAGSYSSYINGVSSNGTANNIIPSMQGFFVHVSNGSFPVTGSLGINNAARVNNLTPYYHKSTEDPKSFIRLELARDEDSAAKDGLAVYFDEAATAAYDKELDALKLKNTDPRFPNLFAYASDKELLSIDALSGAEEETVVPLGVECAAPGSFSFRLAAVKELPAERSVFLADRNTGIITKLDTATRVGSYLQQGLIRNRFFLVFSNKETVNMPAASIEAVAYTSGQSIFVLAEGDRETVRIYSAAGQLLLEQSLNGNGFHELKLSAATGLYIVVMHNGIEKRSCKVLVSTN